MNRIFVSIASYRDKLCSTTLINMYEMAKYPENIYCGLCEQNNIVIDESCIMPKKHPLYNLIIKNIRKVSIPHHQAKGPTYARFICSTLHKNEEFFMQIDSHTLFIKNWDQVLLDMFLNIEAEGHEKVIISHYPPDFDDYLKELDMVTYIKDTRINKDGIPVFNGASFKKPTRHPEKNLYLSCNFFIARKAILNDVPFDPYLPFLFEGEEILYTIRAYTSGYNIFSPNRNILFHHYIRQGEPKFWDDLDLLNRESILKVKYYLSYPIDLNDIKSGAIKNSIPRYGLGNQRRLSDYWRETGISVKTDGRKSEGPNLMLGVIILIIIIIILNLVIVA